MTPAPAADSLLGPLLVWALIVPFAALALFAGLRRPHVPAGWLRRVIAKPAPPDPASAGPTPNDPSPAQPPPGADTGSSPPAATPAASATAPPPAAAAAAAAGSPPLEGARYPPKTFELLAQRLDHSRRLAFVEKSVALTLSELPRHRWLVERYVLVDGYRIPFVVAGENGVFAIFSLSVRPQWEDTAYASRLAGYLEERLPSYGGSVIPGICGVFEASLQARYWYRSGQQGGSWVMGLNWLVPWIQHFGHEHGLGIEDIACLDDLSGPNWSRPVKPGPPPVPDVGPKLRGHE